MQEGWLDEDTFHFYVPATAIDISKAGKKDGKRWIQGIASTDARDLQGEIVKQNGIDFSYFLRCGYFNDDHKSGPEHKVGQPTECRVTKNGLWVKGFLFKNHKRADHYWELLHSLETSGSDRKVGFSVQGKVKRREGNKIVECWIQDIALTPSPINTTTWAEIAKSLSAMKWALNEEAVDKAATASTDSPVVPESLEGDTKKNREDEEETEKSLLNFDEAVSFLEGQHGLSRDAAVAVTDLVFELV